MPDEVQSTEQPYYAVERWLREAFPKAMKPQPSGVSIDVRLYFRQKDGDRLWAGVALLGGARERVENMPLDEPSGLPWLLGILCDLGFDAAPKHRTKPLAE